MPDGLADCDGPIILAHAEPFRLGEVEVVPGTRQVVHDGRSETLEPRVMQVLVALASARGAILSHDDLIERCWDGRIVGDNAIQRVISRLRELAETLGPGAFRVETITKVGYRLVAGEAGSAAAAIAAGGDEPEESRRPRARNPLWLAAGAGLLLAAAAGAAWQNLRAPSAPAVAVTAAGPSSAEALAQRIRLDLARLASARAGSIVVVENGGSSASDYVVQVRRVDARERLVADLSLLSRRDSELLWSATVEQPANGSGDLAQQAASLVGQVLMCASRAWQDGRSLDRPTLRLYFSACERMHDDRLLGQPDDQQIALLREVTRRAPDFALAWAELAIAEVAASDMISMRQSRPTDASRALKREARSHLAKARALDSGLGAVFTAEAELIDSRDPAARIAMLERGIAADPAHAPLHGRLAFALQSVGRMGEAVSSARRCAELEPLSPEARAVFISALAYAGRLSAARGELAAAERVWPNSLAIINARLRYELRFGDPVRAMRMAETGLEIDQGAAGFLRARLDAMQGRDAAAQQAMLGRNAQSLATPFLVQNLAQLGLVDEAFRLLDRSEGIAYMRFGPEVLFRPHMRSLWLDRRFMTVVTRLGLTRYWLQTNRFADFCRDPDLPYDCRVEARRLAARAVA